jgi:hypothetical protein
MCCCFAANEGPLCHRRVGKSTRFLYRGFIHEGQTHIMPNLLQPLTLILEEWARAGQVDSAWAVLGRIRELHELGVLPTGPDLKAYNIMILCLLNCHKDSPDFAIKADTLSCKRRRTTRKQCQTFTRMPIHSRHGCLLRMGWIEQLSLPGRPWTCTAQVERTDP